MILIRHRDTERTEFSFFNFSVSSVTLWQK